MIRKVFLVDVDKTKVIAFYLPQFHAIPENDTWWGKGFTEWTAVRGASPLFPGHKQPLEPLEDRYYNLLDKETMQWQADLAKEYGIGGFAFYHYWFQNGYRVLERPAENLLKWKDIDMPFCFNWASESWGRTWSAVSNATPWADRYETDTQEREDGLLLEQKYGNEEAWTEHIAYLLPFFQDKRYIRVNGRPVFMLYRPESIFCLSDMVDCWNEYLQSHGEEKLFLIGAVHDRAIPFAGIANAMDAYYVPEPTPMFAFVSPKMLACGVKYYDPSLYWELFSSLDAPMDIQGTPVFSTVVNGFDDTPRRGKVGAILPKLAPHDFQERFRRVFQQALRKQHPFLFYNAWNEWGEGMILEPDKEGGYAYLNAIRDVVQGAESEKEENQPKEEGASQRILSSVSYAYARAAEEARTLNRWMELRESGKSVASYLQEQGISHLAIYGYGELGKRLKQELKGTAVSVDYIIDRSSSARDVDCPTYPLSKDLPAVDAIVVTVHGLYHGIREDIKRFVDYPVMALPHLLFECS